MPFWTRRDISVLVVFRVLLEGFKTPIWGQLRPTKAYISVGRDLMWYVLGAPVNEKDLSRLKADPGKLQDEWWSSMEWKRPDKESSPCWWVVNATEVDKTKQPLFACRSLVCLRIELDGRKRVGLSFLFNLTVNANAE